MFIRTGKPAVYVCHDTHESDAIFRQLSDPLGTDVINAPRLAGIELLRSMLASYAFCFFLSPDAYASIADILDAYLSDTGDMRPVYIVADDEAWRPATRHENVLNFSACDDRQLGLAMESFRRILERQRQRRKLSGMDPDRTVFVSIGNAKLRDTYLGLAEKYGMTGFDLGACIHLPEWEGLFDASMIFIMDRWTYLVIEDAIERYLKTRTERSLPHAIFFLAGDDSGVALEHGKIVNRRTFPLSRMIRLFREQRRNDRFADRFLKRHGF